MNCKDRLEKLENLNTFKPNTCKVLSNARCLSEGVDVPALDSIVFFDGKSAMVDIIQAVGRVMRKAKNKKRGYIILPIALEESEIQNLDEAVNNTNFKNIWKVIKALRSPMTQAWLMKPLLKKKSKSSGAMITKSKTMKKPFLTLSYCKI